MAESIDLDHDTSPNSNSDFSNTAGWPWKSWPTAVPDVASDTFWPLSPASPTAGRTGRAPQHPPRTPTGARVHTMRATFWGALPCCQPTAGPVQNCGRTAVAGLDRRKRRGPRPSGLPFVLEGLAFHL